MRCPSRDRLGSAVGVGLAAVLLVAALAVVAGATTSAGGGGADAADAIQPDPEAQPPAAGDVVEIEQVQRGNLFATNETPAVVLEADDQPVVWTVRDYYGRIVASGSERVEGERTVEFPIDRVGHYTLRVRPRGTGPASTARTTLAVLPAGGVDNDDPFFAMSTKFGAGLDHEMMDELDRIGVAAVRDEHSWYEVESRRGEYDFSGPRREAAMQSLQEHGFDRLFLLAYGNQLYAEDWDGIFTFPTTDDHRRGYANYTRAVLEQYPDLDHVEVWNEPNLDTYSGSTADRPELYTRLLEETDEAVQAERPGATVVGGSATANYSEHGTSLLDEPWWEGMLEAGGAEHMDAAAVHLYRSEPTAFDRDVGRLRELIREHNDGQDLPIWVTELGWHTSPHVAGGDLETRQARHLVQSYARLRALGVERYYWYTQADTYYGEDPQWQGTDGSYQAGLLRRHDNPLGENVPKPALLTYATTAEHLADASLETAESDPVERLRFADGDRRVEVLWAPDRTDVTLDTDAPVSVTGTTGDERTLEPVDGEVYLTVGPDPLFVEGAVDDVVDGAPVGLQTSTASTGESGPDPGLATVTYDNVGSAERTVELAVGGETATLTADGGESAESTLALESAFGERAGVAVDVVRIDGTPAARLEAPVGVPRAHFGEQPFVTGMTVETRNTADDRSFSEVNDVGTGHGAFEATTRAGISCYETDVETGTHGRTLYVDLSNDHYHDVDEPVAVTVRYFDDGDGSFALEYDDGSRPGGVTLPEELDGDGRWETATFELEDAAFAADSGGLGGGGSHDLRVTLEGSQIGVSDGDVCFESVTMGTEPATSVDPSGAGNGTGPDDGNGSGPDEGTGADPDDGNGSDTDDGTGPGTDGGNGSSDDDGNGSEENGSGGSTSGGDGIPGFGVGLALAALAVVAGLSRLQR